MAPNLGSLQDGYVITASEVEIEDLLTKLLDAYVDRFCNRIIGQGKPDLSELEDDESFCVHINDIDRFVFETVNKIDYQLGKNIAGSLKDIWPDITPNVMCMAGVRSIEIGLKGSRN